MKVMANHADLESGCALYRIWEPCRVLGSELDITLDHQASSFTVYREDELIVAMDAVDYDVVVFQYPIGRDFDRLIPLLQKQGVAVVVELDDDIWNMHPESAGYANLNPVTSPHHNWDILRRSCAQADLVTVTTPALAKLIPNKNVRVLRNCVPARYLDVEAVGPFRDQWASEVVLGWAGNPDAHIDDLEVMGASLKRAVMDTNSRFFTIGDEETLRILGFDVAEFVARGTGYFEIPTTDVVGSRRGDKYAKWSPWVKLENYPHAVATLDAGIVPLSLTKFNKSKSYLKGLEMSALGVPFVASPTPEYERLHKMGAGLLAHNPAQWYIKLRNLLSSAGLREDLIGRGRSVARNQTYEKNGHLWAEAWQKAVEIRHSSATIDLPN